MQAIYKITTRIIFRYIGMELCSGYTLNDLVKGKYEGPKLGTKREVLHQIISGLEYLHEKNVVHRDIKPQNILISKPISDKAPPLIKLADFGLSRNSKAAKRRQSDDDYPIDYRQLDERFNSHFTQISGTPGWMAPEYAENMESQNYAQQHQIRLTQPVRSAADIFSSGCVFGFFLSDGLHPFGPGNLRVHRIENGEPMMTVDDLNGDRAAFELIQSMVHPDPSQRPTATQVKERIQLLKNCWNFQLGKLTGCDSCTDKPCRIGVGGFATVFKGKFQDSPESNKIDVAIKSIERINVRMAEIDVIEILNDLKSKGHQQENIVRFYDWLHNDQCL